MTPQPPLFDAPIADDPNVSPTPDRDNARVPHRCHHPDCTRSVPPRRLACVGHWYALPKPLRDNIWANYVPGQEVYKNPTPEYLAAARDCMDWWTDNRTPIR